MEEKVLDPGGFIAGTKVVAMCFFPGSAGTLIEFYETFLSKKQPVHIANPRGSKTYTSLRKAKKFVEWGLAVFTDLGELHFLSEMDLERRQTRLDPESFKWKGKESGHSLGRTGIRVMQAERVTA